jgi:hypothetical protein
MDDIQGQVDTLSSVMDEVGDKMVTNCTGTPNTRPRKGGKNGGPCAKVKFGSASVPIYLSQSKGRTRYFLCYHRDGKRLRQTFTDLATAKKEGQFVAQRIQAGMQHVTDLKPHERNSFKAAEANLRKRQLSGYCSNNIFSIRWGFARKSRVIR